MKPQLRTCPVYGRTTQRVTPFCSALFIIPILIELKVNSSCSLYSQMIYT